MNKTITASILSTLIATAPAIAQTDIRHAVFDFDDANSQTFELAVLSNDEMLTTEGEFGFIGAAIGAGVGGVSYAAGALAAGDWGWGSFTASVLSGAVAGGLGATSVAGYIAPRFAAFSHTAGALYDRH